MSATADRRRSDARWVPILLVAVAAIIRAATLSVWSGRLADDRDDYLTVARQYLAHGFWGRFEGYPNSFRPPLYPFVVAGVLGSGGSLIALGVLQVVLGSATVGLTYAIGKRLGSQRLGAIAAASVAFDPLLIEYTAFPMTETLVTFLVALLIAAATPIVSTAVAEVNADSALRPPAKGQGRRLAIHAAIVGAIFGACALCRPTIWPTAALVFLWIGWRACGDRRRIHELIVTSAAAAVATAIVVFPWALRNERLLGSPIITTTHGGYTLLLGNNPEFFHHVAARPWGEDWSQNEPDRFQRPWVEGVIRKMEAEIGVGADEVAKDRWMYRQAWQAISAEPGLFFRACGLRFLRLWNVLPLPPARSAIPKFVLAILGAGYALEFALFFVGVVSLRRCRDERWVPLLLVILNFTAVQLFYWTNTRMRAPLVPLIGLLAARGLCVCLDRRKSKKQPSETAIAH